MEKENNLSKQTDEIEALSSICCTDWCTLDAVTKTYSIQISSAESEEGDGNSLAISLQVQLPTDYPSHAPPVYELSAPWLRGEDRLQLGNALEEIYIENCGEIILFHWVQKVREFLETISESSKEVLQGEEAASNVNDVEVYLDDCARDTRSRWSKSGTKEQMKMEISCPEIFHGDFVTDRKSKFQGHLAVVNCEEQTKLVMEELTHNRKIVEATHRIVAYRILKEGGNPNHPVYICDSQDDGEIHAGNRILHLLEIMGATNVMIIVVRWYGGVHLGPDRFKHINNCAREVLEACGFLRDKADKKSSHKSKKNTKHR